MAPPPPSAGFRLAPLLLKLVTIASLLASLVILTTNTATLELNLNTEIKIRFKDVYAYRYMLATIVVGMAYTFPQIASSLYQISTGNQPNPVLTFYGDKLLSYVLATGAAAGFGATKDLKSVFEGTNADKFFNKGYASAGLVLVGFLCAALLSIMSSYALPKKA